MTKRSRLPNDRPGLSQLEAVCMQLFWERGPMTAEMVRGAMPKALRESTVRTLLKRICEKGYLTHELDGRAYVYRPADAPGSAAATGVRRLAEMLYRGSVADLLVGLVDSRAMDAAELDALMARIQAVRAQTEAPQAATVHASSSDAECES
jgi:BlaI family transcriptional regulator, penicillinase repressor